MNSIIRPRLALVLTLLLASATRLPAEEEGVAVMEEIIVEEPFDVRLQLPQESAVKIGRAWIGGIHFSCRTHSGRT